MLHHVPPIAYPGSTKEEYEGAELLIRYKPDYFVSGHCHQFPYLDGHSSTMNVGAVTFLVPGQLLTEPRYPRYGQQAGDLANDEPVVDCGFAKNERDNIDGSQERSFKDLAKVVLNLSDGGLKALTDSGKWAEVPYEEDNEKGAEKGDE